MPQLIGLTGTEDQIEVVKKEYKVYGAKVPEGKSYTMDHSAGSYVYDTAGRLRVYHRYGSGSQALAADVKALLGEAG